MIAPLNEVVGLPPSSSPVELADACERRIAAVRDKASHGDAYAQRELLKLHIAYLNWAYVDKKARRPAVRAEPLFFRPS